MIFYVSQEKKLTLEEETMRRLLALAKELTFQRVYISEYGLVGFFAPTDVEKTKIGLARIHRALKLPTEKCHWSVTKLDNGVDVDPIAVYAENMGTVKMFEIN
jgi:hypothetical protein